MEAGLQGAQKLPPPGKKLATNRAGGLRSPRRRQALGGRSKSRRRGGARREGRAAGPLRASPGRAGLPSGWEAGSAGRTQGEVSSCFPWLRRGGGEGAGTLAPGQGDSFFFFCLKRRRCRLEERGGAGGWRLGAVPTPDARPARTRRRARWALSRGPSPGPVGRAARFLRAGRGGRPGPLPAPSKRETEAEGWGGGAALPWSRGGGKARWGRNPGLRLFPASLAHVRVLQPQALFVSGAPLWPGFSEGSLKSSRNNKAGNPASLLTSPPPRPCKWLSGAHPTPLPRLVWQGWWGWLWASDTLESPRSELRAWPPSQANSWEEGGAA